MMNAKQLLSTFFLFTLSLSCAAMGRDTLLCQSMDEALHNPSKVYGLHLSGHQDAVKFRQLNQLTQLEILEFSDCDLMQLPEELGQLTELRILRISFNKLIREIPATIGNLTKLEVLQITGNPLLKQIPEATGKLLNLKTLTLEQNNSLQLLPSAIGNLSSLYELRVWHNNSVDSIPRQIGQLHSMQRCTLAGSGNFFIPGDIGQCTSLRSLFIRSMWGDALLLPGALGSLAALDTLVLEGNIAKAPVELGKSHLRYLQLSSTAFTQFPDVFCALVSLRSLTLRNNKLMKGFTTGADKLGTVQSLVLSGNDRFDLKTLTCFRESKNLTLLNLSETRIKKLPSEITQLHSVQTLVLNSLAGVPDKIKWQQFGKTLAQMKGLRTIDLSGNLLEVIPSSFGRLTQIDTLRLNRMQGDGINNLHHLSGSKIKVLTVSTCGLRSVPAGIELIVSLEEIDLSSNQIITADSRLTLLPALRHLDLSYQLLPMGDNSPERAYNDYTLETIHALAGCKTLAVLNLSGNKKIGAQVNDLRSKMPYCEIIYN
jgi:Leucine-rich repeat (LRR) protein